MEGKKRKANEDFGEEIRKRLFGDKCSKSGSNNPRSILKSSEVVVASVSTFVKREVPDNDESERAMLRDAIEKTKRALL